MGRSTRWRSASSTVARGAAGIRHQTVAEARKFGIDCEVGIANDDSQVIDGINLVNYDKLHKFNPLLFAGVVLDESSILKSFTGLNGNEKTALAGRLF